MRNSKVLWIGAVVLSLALLGLALCARAYISSRPELAEAMFLPGSPYSVLAGAYSRLMGVAPFSFFEWVLLLSPLLLAGIVLLLWRFTRKGRGRLWICAGKTAAALAIAASLLAASFVGGWGMSYLRMPYAQTAGLDISNIQREELETLCYVLASRAAVIRSTLQEDEYGLPAPPGGTQACFNTVNTAYETASGGAPWLGGHYAAPKPVLLSKALCHMQIAGIFIPFTQEAHVNTMSPQYQLAAAACHEAAHLRGFAREDEANFIAFYVCLSSDDAYFQYSGLMLALIHAGNALADADRAAYSSLRDTYSEAMNRDIETSNAFWRQYEGKAHELQSRVNDSYLKANGQEDGIKSYGRMVDLLVGYMRAGGV